MPKTRLLKLVRIVWMVSGLSFMAWLFISSQARGFDEYIMESNARVLVADTADYLRFTPRQQKANCGLLFYPGAMIEPLAYAPLARTLADKGVEVVILKLPMRLAPLESQVQQLFNQTIKFAASQQQRHTTWSLGGHSRGGALAAKFAQNHEDHIDGLILIGTSHPKNDDLSDLVIPVTKIYATEDGLASPKEVLANAGLLPERTRWVEVTGGNHAQFGWYGSQLGDGKASISREEQQEILVDAVSDAMLVAFEHTSRVGHEDD